MATIKNIEGMTVGQLNSLVEQGGKFVMYQYTISVLVMTFRRSSDIYFIRYGDSAAVKGLGYTFLTALLGWWGIPWGPIYSIGSLYTNLSGGKNVTQEVLTSINGNAAQAMVANA
jgi:hypothetical protein